MLIMNQIAGADSFSLMSNLRLVVIVAIFIIFIVVLFYNRILGSLKSVKQKDKQAVSPSDDSSREERDASDVVGDFFGKEESTEKEESKVDESAAEPEVEIEDQPADDSSREERDAPGVTGDFFDIEEFTEKEISKGGESTAEPEVEIEGRLADDSSREERDAPGAAGDFLDIEESAEKEISKGGESTAEPEVEIEVQPSVNYEKIGADLKAVRDEVTAKIETDLKAVEGEVTTKIEAELKAVGGEVTTKIEGLILKVEAVEKEVLNKIEDVIDAKIQEASNKINDRISETVKTQIDSINPVTEEREDSLRKEEVPEEIKEKEQTDTIVLSGEIEGKKERDLSALVKDRDILEKLHLFVRYHLDAFDIMPFDEAKAVAEVKKDVKVDKMESVEAITPTGKIEEKKSTGAAGGSVGPARLFFQKFLSAGKPSTEEPKELVEEKVESEKEKERDLETSVEDRDILEKLAGSLQMGEDSFDILPSEESKTVAEEKKEKDLEVSSEVKEDVKVEEKISEGDVGDSVDLDIEKFLEEEPVGISSTEEPNESVEEKVEFKLKEEKEEGLELQAEVKEDVKVDEKEPVESITSTEEVEEKISAGKSVDLGIDKFLEGEPVGLSSTEEFKELVEEVEIEEKKERDLEVQSEVKEDVKVDEKEPIESITSTVEVEEKIPEGDVGESDDFDIEKFLEKDPVGVSPTEESGEVVEEKVEFKLKEENEEDLELPAEEAAAHEEIDEKEIDTIAPPGDIEEKALEADKGEEAEEKKQSTGETTDFDIQDFLEELGTPPSEKE